MEIRPKILEGGGQGWQQVTEGSFAELRMKFTRKSGSRWDGHGGPRISAAGMEMAVSFILVSGERKALRRQRSLTEQGVRQIGLPLLGPLQGGLPAH